MTNNVMRMSQLYAPTLKEDPVDAEIASHRLLLRAGFIRKTASGIYTFLPLGKRVLAKVENIVREEMDGIGAQEVLMPVLQPEELWEESGRAEVYGPERIRFNDRHDHGLCLGPTHEELITALVRNELRSYKDLPCSLYQMQVKFRDEIRPRFGLLRSREFIMKDAYSFNADEASLDETYQQMSDAYGRICTRVGLEWRPVQADAGQIGGAETCEFHALAEAGESALVYCDCGYSASDEVGEGKAAPTVYDVPEMKKIETPGVHTIGELAEFLNIPETSTVKALSGKNEEGKLIVLFVPGDHEVNEVKAARAAGGFILLTDEEMVSFGLHKGSMGPVGLPDAAYVIADASLQNTPKWVVGANEDGYHYVGAELGKDFKVDQWADLITVKPDDGCPKCGQPLSGARGIEVSQVFKLGDKYSKAMGATFMDENGKEKPFLMGCYGVGVSRTLAAVVEQHNDENGIAWPMSIAPAHVCIVPLTVKDDMVQPAAEKLAVDLAELGLEVVIDDRKERAGVKFAEADLMGWPLQVIVGKRGLAEGKVEIKRRATGERRDISLDTLTEVLGFARRNQHRWGNDLNAFATLFQPAAE
jgi:prolyl-tRNA synthetase